MFCPVCKAEYRSGFTRCSDCDVALVDTLGAANASKAALTDPEEQLDTSLVWSGSDPQTFSAVRDALDWAKILHFARTQALGPIPGVGGHLYSVLVHNDDRNAAEAVLQTVPKGADFSNSVAEEDSEVSAEEADELQASDDGGPAPDDIAEDFRADDATAEIWSGDDRGMAETVRMCLRENGIGCAVDQFGGKLAVRVMPGSQDRAREIIREIVEGTPLK